MVDGLRRWMTRYSLTLRRRSTAIPAALGRGMNRIALAWLLLFLLAGVAKLLFSPAPVHGLRDLLELTVPYLLVAIAPIAGYRLAAASFPAGRAMAQPGIRLSIYGKWRSLDSADLQANPVFGPAGFLASLLIGLLLNVVLRSFEFLLAMPALNGHAPGWSLALFHLMAADVVVMSFFYAVCFAMALRTVPLFPRMLLFVWGLDLLIQLIIARQIGATPGVPASVAYPLGDLLQGNIAKILISAFVWLPYLILSDRVNVTYRQRARDY